MRPEEDGQHRMIEKGQQPDTYLFLFIFFNVYLFLRERETEHKQGRGREREGDTEWKQAPGSELSAQSLMRGSNP